jgi:hypothetical protein
VAGTQNARNEDGGKSVDVVPFADTLADILSVEAFAPVAVLAPIVMVTWAALWCARRETSPAVWILAADFHYVEIDLIEAARQI